MGFMIDSPQLAGALADWVNRAPQTVAYEVILTPDGGLEWIELTDQGEIRYHHDPKVGFLERLLARIIGWLPIDSLL